MFLQIVRKPAITLDDVDSAIRYFECWAPMTDRKLINPFTEEEIVASGEGRAVCVIDGELIGNFSLEGGRLLLTGIPFDVASELANYVSADLLEWDHV